eukprot:757779-Prorocentrum_lima.AAC.1
MAVGARPAASPPGPLPAPLLQDPKGKPKGNPKGKPKGDGKRRDRSVSSQRVKGPCWAYSRSAMVVALSLIHI